MLREMAALLEIKGENPFKARAHENAARALESSPLELGALVAGGGLRELPGIGPALAEKIAELAATGRMSAYETLAAGLPPSILELVQIPGLGPKKIHALHATLGVASLDALEAALRDGRVAALPGFGEKTAARIRDGVALVRRAAGRHLLADALDEAGRLLGALGAVVAMPAGGAAAGGAARPSPPASAPVLQALSLAGSLRRFRETVKDIDLVGSSDDAKAVMDAFVALPLATRVVNHGLTKSTILLPSGMQADLRLVTPEEFASALLHFTGSAEHNVQMRALAKERGLKLNEYGLWRGVERLPVRSEAEAYAALGLAEIPPELREGLGELDEAARGAFPPLVAARDVRGVLHCHSTWSDGRQTIEQLATAARDAGYEYLGVTDHSRSAAYAGGLAPERVREQWAEIDALNARLAPFRIFKGIESDIQGDGALDYDDDLLAGFDFVVASVHSRMTMGEAEMTERICRAIAHPATSILGHPSGRRLLVRDPYAVDLDRVVEAARARDVAIELNCNPERMDLDWRVLRVALPSGLTTSINPDAHAIEHFRFIEHGAGVARKAGAQARHVLNTLGRDAIAARFAARRTRTL
jgi:DNA polymerase (family 10)